MVMEKIMADEAWVTEFKEVIDKMMAPSVDMIMAQFDANKDGKIEWDEMTAPMREAMPKDMPLPDGVFDGLREQFKAWDLNNDGVVERQELATFMRQ